MDIRGKTFVVTGASDGIGKAVAVALARHGVNLALLARDRSGLQVTKRQCRKSKDQNIEIFPCDLRQTKKLAPIIRNIVHQFKNIDGLINVAGIWQKLAPIEKIPANEVDNVIQTNLTSLIHCTRLFLPHLKKRTIAVIVNVSSKSGVVAQEGQSVYTASKYGVCGFTEVLKVDLKNTGVRVAGVYQSGTNTKMFKKAGDKFSTAKFTQPKDLADAIVYMISRPDKMWIHEIHIEY